MVLELWKDPRLEVEHCGFGVVSIPAEVANCIWQPDLIFPNSKMSHLHKVTVDNVAVKLIPGNYIMRYGRYLLTVSCPMMFKNYPLDTQTCPLNITLFSSFGNEVNIHWINNETNDELSSLMGAPIVLLSHVQPLQFSMEYPVAAFASFRVNDIDLNFLLCIFTFQRHITAALVNTYIPSFLVVCLSMVSFWIDVKAVPGRVTLGVTALLTLSTMIVHARSSLPPVNYMTAMDIWLFGCLLLVFLSLIEFTMAQAISRSVFGTNKISARRVRAWPTPDTHDIRVQSSVGMTMKKRSPLTVVPEEPLRDTPLIDKPKKQTQRIEDTNENFCQDNLLDRWSRILFPSIMIFFVALYWYFFLKTSLYNNE